MKSEITLCNNAVYKTQDCNILGLASKICVFRIIINIIRNEYSHVLLRAPTLNSCPYTCAISCTTY